MCAWSVWCGLLSHVLCYNHAMPITLLVNVRCIIHVCQNRGHYKNFDTLENKNRIFITLIVARTAAGMFEDKLQRQLRTMIIIRCHRPHKSSNYTYSSDHNRIMCTRKSWIYRVRFCGCTSRNFPVESLFSRFTINIIIIRIEQPVKRTWRRAIVILLGIPKKCFGGVKRRKQKKKTKEKS